MSAAFLVRELETPEKLIYTRGASIKGIARLSEFAANESTAQNAKNTAAKRPNDKKRGSLEIVCRLRFARFE
jgi:hypothetical protein